MMIWEDSKDPMVKLCVEFRKAVVNEFRKNPKLEEELLGAFTPEELAEFSKWSVKAMGESLTLQGKLKTQDTPDPKIVARLDEIVLDMSEKSAEAALRVLGQEKLQEFVSPENRTQELSDRYKKRNYPSLAKVFGP